MVLLAILITAIACFTGAAATGGALQTAEVTVSSNALQLIEDIVKKEIHSNLVKMYIGLAPEYAASSCKQIAELKPEYNSGYYWIQGVSGAVGVYCNNTFYQSGGWMRIANVDMRNNHSQCPPGLVYNVTEGRRLCRKPSLAPGLRMLFNYVQHTGSEIRKSMWEGGRIPVLYTTWIWPLSIYTWNK